MKILPEQRTGSFFSGPPGTTASVESYAAVTRSQAACVMFATSGAGGNFVVAGSVLIISFIQPSRLNYYHFACSHNKNYR